MKQGVHGEGNYEATRKYNQRTKKYLDSADVSADAHRAAPGDPQEAREMQQAEAEGKRHAKGGMQDEDSDAMKAKDK
jgi:hypothetical protein